MAAIWAAHQVNIRRGKGERLKIGVSGESGERSHLFLVLIMHFCYLLLVSSVYDSCSSAQVIQRQSVRLVASSIFSPASSSPTTTPSSSPHHANHLLPSLKNCRDTATSKAQPLIFGTKGFGVVAQEKKHTRQFLRTIVIHSLVSYPLQHFYGTFSLFSPFFACVPCLHAFPDLCNPFRKLFLSFLFTCSSSSAILLLTRSCLTVSLAWNVSLSCLSRPPVSFSSSF